MGTPAEARSAGVFRIVEVPVRILSYNKRQPRKIHNFVTLLIFIHGIMVILLWVQKGREDAVF